ncbi:hypothetical protein [Spongiactinospora sp. TRM90649]|uniref:hypothetical protein n=1 Tax=Spongiactinospora sp. TRM90649 TaxID=3031114 RepID=UPI0023F6C7EB|nr:hypothetical protein [Spongiactinospora sp. TRM90649]MDF5756636.1 hypothetical protein [Spongiactinospora sp. TRM90649]
MMLRTVRVGPMLIFFSNVNVAMRLRGHFHSGRVYVTYEVTGAHGYPSFETTNRALLEHLHTLTRTTFRDATNEDVADRIFAHLDGWTHPSWEPYGGRYRLRRIDLDVLGVFDDIGHDAGWTRYTVERQEGRT